MREVTGTNHKFLKMILPIGCLPLILLLFPYMIQGETRINGIQMTNALFHILRTQGLHLFPVVFLLSLFVLPTFLLILAVFIYLKPGKKIIRMEMVLFTLYTAGTVFLMLGFKNFMDQSGLIGEVFLIKDLSPAYWSGILLGFCGMVVTMKSLKRSPAYIVLVILSVIWLFPIVYILLNSLRLEGSFYVGYLFPKEFGFDNYINIITDTSKFHYVRWFKNTLVVAICSCTISSFIVLSTAYAMSRIRFRGRKTIMKFLLILGMFPSVMSMIAVYYVIKGMGLSQSLTALVIVYSANAALSYLVAKGFFDTIPKAMEEAAYIDGATKMQVFLKIMIPLAKPIIVYTILVSFLAPWADFIFATVILGDKTGNYTLAMGLFSMISRDNIDEYFTQFAAGAVMISVPIAALFISLQKYYVEGLSGSVKG